MSTQAVVTPVSKRRKRSLFGPLTYTALVLLLPALVWRFGLGGWEGWQDRRAMSRLAYDIHSQKSPRSAARDLIRYEGQAREWVFWLLDDGNPLVRRTALDCLSRLPDPGEADFNAALERLDDRDLMVRSSALSAANDIAGKLGRERIGDVRFQKLADASVRIWVDLPLNSRVRHLGSLFNLGSHARAGGSALESVILEPQAAPSPRIDPGYRADAFWVLGRVDPERADRLGLRFVEDLLGDDPARADLAEQCLREGGVLLEKTSKRLHGLFDGRAAIPPLRVVKVLAVSTSRRQAAAERRLIAIVADRSANSDIRVQALEFFTKSGFTLPEALVPILINELRDKTSPIRAQSLEGVRLVKDKRVIPQQVVQSLGDDPDPKIRMGWLILNLEVRRQDEAALGILARLAEDADPEIAATAVMELGHIGPPAKSALESLVRIYRGRLARAPRDSATLRFLVDLRETINRIDRATARELEAPP